MYQLAHVANTILYRAKNENMPVSPMKLQKLIYFLYAEYLYQENEPLFAERFEAWRYGPVLDDVYQAFKEYHSSNIKKYMPDANGRYKVIDLDSDYEFLNCFNTIWVRYANRTGIQLSGITHEQCSAWYAAASRGRTFLRDEDILEEMRIRNNGE